MKKPAIQAVSLGWLKWTVARSWSYQYLTKVCFMRCRLPTAIALVLAHAAVIRLLWTTQRMLPNFYPKDLLTLTAVFILYQIIDIKYQLAMLPPMIQLFKTSKTIRLNFGRVLIQCRIPFLQTTQPTVPLQISTFRARLSLDLLRHRQICCLQSVQ